MTQNSERGVSPVFIPSRNLPEDRDQPYTTREICSSAEKTSGYATIIGAQKIGGLWRLYPATIEARAALLLKGVVIRKTTVNPFDKNPFIVQGQTEAPTTKLIIGNLPISYSNDEIDRKLNQLGCELHSKIMMERDRDERGGLTRWLTGRRFVYIKVPSTPLPEKIPVGPATATLYHREQKAVLLCSKCLEKGHRAAMCTNPVVCKVCKQKGHKRGDPACPLEESPITETSDNNAAAKADEAATQPIHDDPPAVKEPRHRASHKSPAEPRHRSRSRTPSRTRSLSKRGRENSNTPEKSKNARVEDSDILNGGDGDAGDHSLAQEENIAKT
jgi:hypothetical protein